DGDAALLDLTDQFDGWRPPTAAGLELTTDVLQAAVERVAAPQLAALKFARDRLTAYHEQQKARDWTWRDELGNTLGQRVTALQRVGIYVPGGRAAYPSSVLMNAIPAAVAGVGEIIMCVPTPAGERNDLVLAAAQLVGVDRVFAIGGAQGVGAMAFGTGLVPAVDKIVGPGNRYVAAAKKAVFGTVGIDMLAGPSEVVVIADGSVDPEWIAADLFSQAEHDAAARAILIATDEGYLRRVHGAMAGLLPTLSRAETIRASLAANGAMIQVTDLAQAVEVANRLAPEHLQLAVRDGESLLPSVTHAGAVFVGGYSPEAMGDYCAGPNHVLPTAGTARFSSPLGVYDFQKRTSVIHCTAQGAQALGRAAEVLAQAEGLTAHALSARLRCQ
ncbi:MAG: histidinol dehydrogenase, partial [Halioglobus sp.]|nr:histidinol dehydrogenase [Halioglobus sp.]